MTKTKKLNTKDYQKVIEYLEANFTLVENQEVIDDVKVFKKNFGIKNRGTIIIESKLKIIINQNGSLELICNYNILKLIILPLLAIVVASTFAYWVGNFYLIFFSLCAGVITITVSMFYKLNKEIDSFLVYMYDKTKYL